MKFSTSDFFCRSLGAPKGLKLDPRYSHVITSGRAKLQVTNFQQHLAP